MNPSQYFPLELGQLIDSLRSEIEKELKEKANKSARVIVAKHGSLGEEHNILFTGLYSVKKAAKHDAWETQRGPLQPGTHMHNARCGTTTQAMMLLLLRALL